MADSPATEKPSTRPYIVLRSLAENGAYVYVATVETGDADRAIKQAREDAPQIADHAADRYRDEWHAIPARNWTTLDATTVEPPPITTWTQGRLPGTQLPTPEPPALVVVEDEA